MAATVKNAVRLKVFRRDDWRCAYCGCRVNRDVAEDAPDRATLDHIVPRCRGGKNAQTNLLTACYACNQRKGASGAFDPDPKPWPTLAEIFARNHPNILNMLTKR